MPLPSDATLLITGGAGFIGSCVVRQWLADSGHHIAVLDKLTYAGRLESLASVHAHPRLSIEVADIGDVSAVRSILDRVQPMAVLHLAAETHVDRSISGPARFIETNVMGTFTLLEAVRDYWERLSAERRESFRFLHVSTDEVYGTLGENGYFDETRAYAPNSPYAASKAASDHLARAWHETYGLPVLITNCSNNYGLYQFPEKLIPLMIRQALAEACMPIYGDGLHVRDWLFVEDHAKALRTILERGRIGQTYCIGGRAERSNRQIVEALCQLFDELRPSGKPHARLIEFVADRPGHDRRYAIDCTKLETELGWHPQESFEAGLRKTVQWYLDHPDWLTAANERKLPYANSHGTA